MKAFVLRKPGNRVQKEIAVTLQTECMFDAKSESPIDDQTGFLVLGRSLVAATARETGPFKSVSSSNLASFDFISVSAQLRSFDEKSVSALIPATGGSSRA